MRVVISLLFAAFTLTAQPDAALGTWRFLPAESTYESGPAPRESQRVWEKAPNGQVRFIHTGVGATGQPFRTEFTVGYDGKPAPVTGGSLYDSVSLQRVDARTIDQTFRKAGKITVQARRTISPDGTRMTIIAMGAKADGKPFRNKLVYARK